MCHGKPCGLPFCTYRPTGSALGKKKPEPSVRGRDDREQAYIRSHPFCELCLVKPAIHVHHIGGRKMGGWRRKVAALQALCAACHEQTHLSSRPKEGS